DAELDHVGAEVVLVAAQARLWLHAHDEVVDALGAVGGRPHAQHVEVVGDRVVVVVLGQVAQLEVHQERAPAKYRAAMSRSSDCSSRPTSANTSRRSWSSPSRARNSRSATTRLRRSTGSDTRSLWSAATSAW